MAEEGDVLDSARRAVRRASRHLVTWAAIPVLAFALGVAIQRNVPHTVLWVELVTLCVLGLALWLDRERSARGGSIVLCSAFFVVNSCALMQFGPLMGTGMMFLGWALFMVFFFDSVVVPLALTLGEMVLVGALTELGVLRVPAYPADGLLAWIRVTGTVGIMLGVVTFLARRLVRGLREAVERERLAREREEAAQNERERSLHALATSHRLEAIGQLAGGIAHDFNNVLTVLLSGVDALQSGVDAETEREILDDMERACKGASATTRQLLSMARQGSSPADTADPVASLPLFSKSLARVLPESIRVRSQVETQAHVALGTGVLEQCLLNLCLNARDAMPNGGELTLHAFDGKGADGRACVAVEVRDSGHGMDAEVESRAFEPFFTTKQGHGTGLGLTMVRRCVESAGGRLEIESTCGRGTTVRMLLPVADQGDAGELDPPDERVTPAIRVLYLEDDRAVRDAVRRMLVDLGYDVVCVDTVANAVRTLGTNPPFDLFVTDARLPDGDPTDAISAFRRGDPSRPVLVCSGYVASEGIVSGLEQGKFAFLQKPIDRAGLRRALSQVLFDPIGSPRSGPGEVASAR